MWKENKIYKLKENYHDLFEKQYFKDDSTASSQDEQKNLSNLSLNLTI